MPVLHSEFFIGIAAISTGMMAGIYFAFSVFIMDSFKALPNPTAVASMQSINKVILSSGFMPLFFGSSLLALTLIFIVDNPLEAPWVKGAGAIYVVGMFLCTLFFNVPLNNRLENAKDENEARQIWLLYRVEWTRWNHLRSFSSFLACIGYIVALV